MSLTPWLIRYGYEQGAFPMTMRNGEVDWFQPFHRALFPIEGMHVPRSLKKDIRDQKFTTTFDKNFEGVMRGCLRPEDNWISEEFIQVYTEIHREGWAHSCEAWLGDELVGGTYGIALGSCFCAESMFHAQTNASKIALKTMIDKCRELGFTIFDAQVMNPHLRSLGAFEVTHNRYLQLLRDALGRKTPWSGGSSKSADNL